jgi:hypothetical protein
MRHGNMEKNEDMETWRYGDMGTWRHKDMTNKKLSPGDFP